MSKMKNIKGTKTLIIFLATTLAITTMNGCTDNKVSTAPVVVTKSSEELKYETHVITVTYTNDETIVYTIDDTKTLADLRTAAITSVKTRIDAVGSLREQDLFVTDDGNVDRLDMPSIEASLQYTKALMLLNECANSTTGTAFNTVKADETIKKYLDSLKK
jgi:hypothetical protein